MNYVKLESGTVTETASAEREGYVSAPDNVQIGWTWDGTAWTPPVLSEGETIRQALLAEFAQEASGVQLMFAHLLEPLRVRLQSGQITAAKTIIETVPVPSTVEPLRARLLSHFP